MRNSKTLIGGPAIRLGLPRASDSLRSSHARTRSGYTFFQTVIAPTTLCCSYTLITTSSCCSTSDYDESRAHEVFPNLHHTPHLSLHIPRCGYAKNHHDFLTTSGPYPLGHPTRRSYPRRVQSFESTCFDEEEEEGGRSGTYSGTPPWKRISALY